MFFWLIGFSAFLYFLFYIVCFCIFDCDVLLGLCTKFGKSIATLRGKVVFITGASSGIGESLAIALAKNGVKLVLTARREEELQRVKTKCIEKSKELLEPDDVLIIAMDVMDIGNHEKYFKRALDHFGQVDILVSNAGRSQRADWENVEQSVHREMFDLNVHAVVSLSSVAVKYFSGRAEGGHVAVMSSVAGVAGVPCSGTYSATKHAIHGYFNSLRMEKLGKNITVSLFCPGPTATNLLANFFSETTEKNLALKSSPTDRLMTAKRCGFLCATALANKLDESWIALVPIVPFTYLSVYFPNTFKLIVKLLGPKNVFKVRESEQAGAAK